MPASSVGPQSGKPKDARQHRNLHIIVVRVEKHFKQKRRGRDREKMKRGEGISERHIIIIIFMQCIDSSMSETNHVSRVHTVAAALYLHFMLHVMLFSMLNMFCTSTPAL